MKGIYFLVEEQSIKPVIEAVMSDIIDIEKGEWFDIKIHQGKRDLLKAIPRVLPTLSKVPNTKIVILHDQDQNDCLELKKLLVNTIEQVTCYCPYKIRIVCKELESWFLGDLQAIQKTFPKFSPAKFKNSAKFRNPDDIQYPSKELLRIIPELAALSTLPKVRTAEAISRNLDINKNSSDSFNQFVDGVKALMEL